MEKTSIVHITLAGAIGALAVYFNILLVPLIVLTVVMAVDYLTGMFSASRTCEEASNRPRPAIWHEAARKKLENEVT